MNKEIVIKNKEHKIALETLKRAFQNVCTAKAMTFLFEENFKVVSKYVHATSRGHEAIQTAVGMQLKPKDYAYPYYRDDSMLLAIGMQPYQLMLQVLAKRDDPFSGGRTYSSHPSLRDAYNAAVQALHEFRQLHVEYAAMYIIKPAQGNKQGDVGTGGTPFTVYLKKHMKETAVHLL